MPPLAEPSSLVSTTPVTSTASVNWRACTRPFWPVVASMTSSTSVTTPAPFSATRRTFDSSSIRFDLVCSRPGGVGQHEVGALGGRRFDGVEDDRRRVGALTAAHQLDARPLGPGAELLGGGGPEGVAGGHDDAVAVDRQPLGDLADGGGLADAVDADEQPDVGGVGVEAQRPLGGQPGLELGGQGVAQPGAVGDPGFLHR